MTLSPKIIETLDPCVVLIKELIAEHASKWEGEEKGGIFSLAQGVVHWQPPQSSIQAMQASLQDVGNSQVHTYGPDEGLFELRSALEQKLSKENGLSNHDVMVTVGANQAYVNCVLTLLSSDDASVVFAPYYFNHVMALQMTIGDDNVAVGPSSSQGIPDLDWLEAQFDKESSNIRMVTLVNPGNPTGVTLSRAVLQRAVDLCAKHNCWLILDCTYEYFVYDNKHVCFPEPHVIHIFSFSKAYSLAGFRCGYLSVHKEAPMDVFKQMVKVQDTIPIGPARMSQVAALGAMDAGKGFVLEQIETLQVGKEAILKALEPLEVMGGSGAMYVMAKLPEGKSDDMAFSRSLVEHFGLAIIPGTFCGFPGWIRVCYANLPSQKCIQAAERLRSGIQELLLS
jgi:aspartate/methionine/tyrosine aminotransferase